MSDLRLIEKLERHIGFVHHRLNCDGNWFAGQVNGDTLSGALQSLGEGCRLLREAMKSTAEVATKEAVQDSFYSFDDDDYFDERSYWE